MCLPLSESSIGAGVRRVEALVGSDAYRFLAREHVLVAQLTDILKVRPDEIEDRVGELVSRVREAEKEVALLRAAQLRRVATSLAAEPHRRSRGVGRDAPLLGRGEH